VLLKLRLVVALAAVALAALTFGSALAAARAAGLAGSRAVLAAETATLVVLCAALAALLVRTTTREERTLRLRAPRELVFEMTTAPENLAGWSGEVSSIEWLAGRQGEPGSRYRIRHTSGIRMTVEVLTIEPPARVTTRMRAALAVFDTERTYEPAPEGTVVRVSQTRRLSLAARLSMWVQRSRLRRKVEAMDGRMVADIERTAAAAPLAPSPP
jgi:uncharacterized protein YndB with AHSA1/START domain